eukprot:scaffold116127_cov21-Phaeocystis_antarctica.AAC.1
MARPSAHALCTLDEKRVPSQFLPHPLKYGALMMRVRGGALRSGLAGAADTPRRIAVRGAVRCLAHARVMAAATHLTEITTAGHAAPEGHI